MVMQKQDASQACGRIFSSAEADSFFVMGIRITPLITSADSGNIYTMMEQTVPPGEGTPPHICHREDKVIYVLDGEFEIRLERTIHRAQEGWCTVIPAGMIHNFRNSGTRIGRLLVTLTPGGHELFLREIGELDPEDDRKEEKMNAIMRRYGVEIIPEKATRNGQGKF